MTESAGRRVLILGGARSGKSAHAEALLRDEPQVDYVATATHDPADAEWAERIARHRERRPAHWNTIETIDLAAVLSRPGPAALVDSITAWLSETIGSVDAWRDAADALDLLAPQLDRTVGAWASTGRRVIAVSDEVGSGIVPAVASARMFRDALGLLNQRLAASADEVWLVTAGVPLRLR
ncbi:MAG: bifunctional adenosylcobinamide kinase/adenosylcobinamide-phosphate guanylyltransferase [Actinomycetota bacterium]|nr:bifunctional adenosylcobinamide kinase/adenosylcobinamide-phosphate guanylyltransferase [Actinomycetota bacterium]